MRNTAALLGTACLLLLASCGGEAQTNDGVAGNAGSAPLDCTGAQPASMVQLPQGYSIDSTEVTRCQYQAWLDTKPSLAGQDAWCSWNTDYTPTCEDWPPGDKGNYAVDCVDWCDAFAYCKAVGKRLCGKIGGGAVGIEDFDDPSQSQWYNACSTGGKYSYPYGNVYDNGQRCNDADYHKGDPEVGPVGMSGCQSPEPGYSGVHDLSGNVHEFEDSCTANTGANDLCHMRGGSAASEVGYASCFYDIKVERNTQSGGVGFRCCSQ